MSKFNDFMLQWGTDKFLHFMAGAAGFAITESWIVLGILAFGKEIYDKYFGSGWSNKDAFATVLGGIFAFIGDICWEFIIEKLPFVIY
tara:strand:- start:133 stop:396 length:264 start_codon:yes stop_codon:yes gene_type:complete